MEVRTRITLTSVSGELVATIDSTLWGRARYDARQAGWKPAETLGVDGWLGNYDRPAGQTVTAEDAAALGHALGRIDVGGLTVGQVDKLLRLRWLCEAGAFTVDLP
jgi:hypothetical protein